MALALNSIIPHTTALSLSTSLPSPKMPSSPQFQQPHNRRQSGPIVQSTASSSSNTAVSDGKLQLQEEDHSNGFNPTSTFAPAWSEFARNVSGEWDDHGADFTKEGYPIELPENVVPEAYREWEVKVFDWQTQCPTLANPDEHILLYKNIELLPTVGCEADAATRYRVIEKNAGGLSNEVFAFAYQCSGCYVSVLPIQDKGTYKLQELEYCLINPQDKESRVRTIQVIRIENEKMMLQNIRVYRENWYRPFRNGDQLGGCAIRDSAFACTAALEASEVVGTWQGLSAVANFRGTQNNVLQELLVNSEQSSMRDESGLVLLPKRLWCSVKERKDGDTCSEVGWLLDHGHAITSRCTFSSTATPKEISVVNETAVLKGT
ncbi:uncharacterized protein LOC126621333 isoform X4 [Malus sylvestris]|uniref:uncharacterized protein LOC126621333 isoform X4 n=1 Tax=Malus sylvestris TaxID=3752 RepID=UPI0021ACCCDA|nr:uncharacterized protein LOC126621333 isoform X4 [Malus sylvestris]